VVLQKSGAKVGSTIVVTAAGAGQSTPSKLVTAEVTAVEAEFDATGSFTVVRGYDPVHRLFRGRRTETYTQVTASDVAKKVAQRAGLAVGRIDATTTVFEHVTQGGVSDWEFLDKLAREIGREVRVTDGKFEFRNPRPAADAPATNAPKTEPLALHQGTDLIRFRAVVTSAQQVKEVQVRGWDVTEKRALIGTAPSTSTGTQLQGASPGELAKTFGDPVYVASDVPYRTQAEVDAAATSLAEQFGGAFAEFEGVARGNPELHAGSAIAIGGMGAPFDGRYVVTTTRHVYDQTAGYTTQLTVSGRQDRSLLGLASGGAGGGRGIAGVVVATVSDVRDPEQLGRVKLTFPWLSDDYVSDWTRTVHAGAGQDRGWLVLPEVGDEVLAAFEQGDVRRPYVIGGLYNGKDKPRLGDGLLDNGTVKRRGFVSRKGHRAVFLDGPDQSGIALLTGDDRIRIALKETGTVLHLFSDGTIEIESTRDLSLKSKAGITIEATGQLQLKGATVAIEGSGPVSVRGATISLN
jgi:phage protein D